jgi:hypothetical protein
MEIELERARQHVDKGRSLIAEQEDLIKSLEGSAPASPALVYLRLISIQSGQRPERFGCPGLGNDLDLLKRQALGSSVASRPHSDAILRLSETIPRGGR